MTYLKREDITSLNRMLIDSSGGYYNSLNSNLLKPNSFNWLIQYVKEKHFGIKRLKSVFEVASAYCFFIINDHIFNDGNKRTGTATALFFLEKNGYLLKDKVMDSDLEKLALSVGSKKSDLKYISQWFKKRTVKK